jgi:dihydropyrimidinase
MEVLTTTKGVNSFKAFMAYKDIYQLDDKDLLSMFDNCRRLGALPMVHAENGDAIDMNQKKLLNQGVTVPAGHLLSRTEEVETEATLRAITLANQVNSPLYVVHVMSNSAADIIAEKRKQGYIVFGEALASGLACSGSNYFNKCWRHAAAHVMSPPIRPDTTTPGHLMDKLASGNLQTTGSDHCTFNDEQKALGAKDFTKIPNGVNGVEERLRVVWEKGVVTGKLDPCKFVEVTSTNAAKLFNIYPRKGRIAVGSDADVVVWDPNQVTTISAATHHSAISFNVFEGLRCHGGPRDVITGGRIVMEGGRLEVERGAGRFVATPTFNQQIFYKVNEREKAHVQLVNSLKK